MKVKYFVFALLTVGFGYLVYYRIAENKKTQQMSMAGSGKAGPGKTEKATQVNGIVVRTQNFNNSLSVTGGIDANEQVQIRSEVSGLVTKLGFNEGSYVTKGSLLVKINDIDLQAQLRQALTKEKLSSENEYRAKILYGKEAISKEEYQTALADLNSLKAQTQLIRAQLQKTEIKAPFSGKIGLRTISVGEYLTPATAVANLVSSDPVKVTVSIPEKYAGQVKLNSTFTFTTAESNKVHTATIYALEPGISVDTRTMNLKAKASNPNGELLPGSFAKVSLPLSTLKDAILVPTEAIIPVLKGKKVFVNRGGKATEVMVETTVRTGQNVLVTSGIKAGDTVLTSGMMSIKAGSPVKVVLTKDNSAAN